MRPTEQSGDEAKRFRAPDGMVRSSWLRRTAIGVLEWLLTRLTGRTATSGYAALIETLPFGVACWAADARLRRQPVARHRPAVCMRDHTRRTWRARYCVRRT